MSSENFENLEDDFVSIKDALAVKIKDVLPKATGQRRKNLASDIQRELDNAQRLLEDLEVEARKAPYPFRLEMNNRLKRYRQDLSSLNKKASQSESFSGMSSRSQLFAPSNPERLAPTSSGIVAGNRSRLLQMNETISQTGDTVRRTQQVAAETEQIAVAVVDELDTQKESLLRTRERLVDTDVNLSRSRKILRSMYRRVITDKLILVIIIILELGILGSLIWYKFFKK